MKYKALVVAGLIALGGALQCNADKYWEQKVSLFDHLPITSSDIVFLGNSITDGGNFEELFQREDVKNRGIRSDAIPGVMKRLDQITKGHPKKIFLLIGVNDISHNLTLETLTKRYEKLVDEILKKSPETKLYIQSCMPINNSFGVYKTMKGKEQILKDFNREIERIANERGLKYIDLWPFLADGKGNLKKNFTNDGLHLTGPGYRAWTNGIKEYLDE